MFDALQSQLDINRIAELSHLTVEDGTLRIGATVRHATLEAMTTAGVLGRLLAEVAPSIAHRPIRSRGTFCGSLVNADPASEWCLAAVTLGAEIVACSQRGVRVIAADKFLTGAMTTALEVDELVTACHIELLPDGAGFGFNEVSRRAGDFAMAAALVTFRLENGHIVDPHIGIGGVEPAPRRLGAAEAMLAGAMPERGLFRAAAATAAAAVEPMEDGQIGRDYRRRLTAAVLERALERSLS